MDIAVQKFGGSSLATAAQMRRVAERVARSHWSGRSTVVVVSARGKTTDLLLREAATVSSARSARELDQLLMTGENVSAALLALALHDRQVPALSLTGTQAGITSVGGHGYGIIAAVSGSRVLDELGRGNVVVVTGFQGVAGNGDVLTLGRGGSDTTAVALAVALGATSCEIYTDVDGVHTADPRVVPDSRVLATVPAEVMAEMAISGAQVMHHRAVELAAVRRMDVVVRGAMSRAPGTTILGRSTSMIETDGLVVAVTHDLDVVGVTVGAASGPTRLLPQVLTVLGGVRTPADMVSLSGTDPRKSVLRFAIPLRHLAAASRELHRAGAENGWEITVTEQVGQLSVVGIGLQQRPDFAAQVVESLARRSIPTLMFSSAQSRVSVLVPREYVNKGVTTLHHEFGLNRPDNNH